MYSAFREFFSFEAIEKELDQLFRLYVDFNLITFRSQSDKREGNYGELTHHFRTRLIAAHGGAEEQQIARSYLYWFDLRADYWAQAPMEQEFIDLVSPDKASSTLEETARLLHGRLGLALEHCLPRNADAEAHARHRTAADRCLLLLQLAGRQAPRR